MSNRVGMGIGLDWDCDLTTITGPNPRTSSEVSSGEEDIQNLFVFEKIYDASTNVALCHYVR